MSSTKIYHVQPTEGGKWSVRAEGMKEAESVHGSVGAALKRAEELAPADGEIRFHEDEKNSWMMEASERAISAKGCRT